MNGGGCFDVYVLKLAQRCSTPPNAAQPRSTQTCSNCSTLLNPTQKSNFNLQNSQCLQCVSCTRVPLLGTSAHIEEHEEQPTDPSTVACKGQGMRSPQKSSLAAAWLYALAAPDTGKRQLSTCACPSHLTQSWRVGSVCFLLGPRFPKIGSSPGTRASSEEANATRRRTNEGYILNDRLLGLTDPFHRSDSA